MVRAARWLSPGFLCDACAAQRKAPCIELRFHQKCACCVCDGCYQRAMEVSKGLRCDLTEPVPHVCLNTCGAPAIQFDKSAPEWINLDDTSPTSSATGDLDKWEASWWREISTIDGDDVSDFER